MPVSARIARLLRIASLTEGNDVLEVVLPCPEANCGAAIEVALPLDRLLEDERDTAPSWSEPIGVDVGEEKRVELRRPTGADQRAWREHAFASAGEAMQEVVRSLAAPAGEAPSFGERELAVLAGAMEEADPLAAFRLSTVCPACAREVTIPVDLEAEMLRRLAAAQRRVVQEIHDLASRYGWSESQILAIPPRRRARYLRLIESSEPSLP